MRPSSPTEGAARSAACDGWPTHAIHIDQNLGWFSVEFEPALVLHPQPALAIVRRLRCDGAVVCETTIALKAFADADEAEQHHAWMQASPERWQYWGRLASTFDASEVFELVEHGAVAAAIELEQQATFAREQKEHSARLWELIQSFVIELNGRYGMTLQRGSEVDPFWTIMFREKWERERFRDWFRVQADRFAEFADYLQSNSEEKLEQRLLAEMLRTEREVKKAGLGSGGRRPLRFWRGEVL